MAIVKTIYPNPNENTGLGADPIEVTDGTEVPASFEIEVEPEDEDVEIVFGEEEPDEDIPFDANLAKYMDEAQLAALASDLLESYEDDVMSRKDWIETYVEGIDLLGMQLEERTEPWDGACGVVHPLLSEALVKFQAETMMETFPAGGPLKTKVVGKETKEKLEASKRVKEDMNHQIMDVMVEYRSEHERLLWGLGLAGNAFKKLYFDPSWDRQAAIYIPAEDVVVPYGASNIESAERVTHVMRKTENQVKKLQAAGFYVDVDLGEPTAELDEVDKKLAENMGFSATQDDRHKLLEMHVHVELDDFDPNDGIALPYVVTIDKSSSNILSVRRNWLEDDKKKEKRNHFVHYSYIPGFGFYAFGLVHLIGAFAKAATSITRQLVDAGTLSNLPGGYKTRGLKIKGDDTPISPAEFRDVDVVSGTIQDNLMTLPYKEPSQVLHTLLQNIVQEARQFATAADLKVSDMSSQSPVGTTLAILERSLKVMSAVQARIHYAMKQEIKLLKIIIRDHASDEYAYEPEEGESHDRQADYELVDVIPVSDPNSATMAQKVVQYQAVLQLAETKPDMYDLPFLHREMLDILGIKNSSKIIPMEDDIKPQEPVFENMNIMNNKPVRAFLYQDHEAHIAVHMAMSQDPKIQEMVGQSPNATSIMSAMGAHISEHLAFAYRKQIEEQAGVPYPPPDEDMDEETDLQVSRLAAKAAEQLLGVSQAEKAAEAAKQAAEDPIVQMQQKELELKEKDLGIKDKKLILDTAAKKDEIASKERIEGMKVGAQVGAAKEKAKEAGMKLGIEVAKEARAEEESATDKALKQEE
jgi:hypothetical protein